jgi:hypothetical protein
MKKPLISLVALTASVMTSGAIAANMESPLYMPKNNELYVKAAAAMMAKTVEGTQATDAKGAAGNLEFPVWRFFGDFGYGITDRLDVHGHFGYTKDGEIDRKGMHRGRMGLMYRVLTEEQSSFVLDLYTDAYLSGVSPMKGTYTKTGFNFSNYSNGRWGAIVGTRFGKTLGDWTLGAHIEYLQTFGNHNNKIGIEQDIQPLKEKYGLPYTMGQFGFPEEISVDLKSTHETVAGFDVMYQANQKLSFGTGFEYIEHYNNGVKSIHTQIDNVTLGPVSTNDVIKGLLAETANMKDGWDEYVIKTSAAYQLTDSVQLATFLEYTFDDAQPMSQNATDLKIEWGLRVNARF